MKKPLKILALVLGGLIALLIAGAIILSLVFDPNQYKDDIIRVVKEQTGRDLKIDGKISLSFFPWLGAELPALELSNAPGFGKQPFARVKQAGVHVKLLPLLKKEVVVKQLTLDGLQLHLAKNRDGKANYEFTAAGAREKPAAKAPATDTPAALGGFAIGGVVISDAEVTWDDAVSGSHYAVRRLGLKTGQIASGKPADLKLGFDLESGEPKISTRVDMTARLALDMAKQTLDLPALSLDVAGMNLRLTDVKGSKILDAPAFNGKLDIASFNLRDLMRQLGIKFDSADSKALTRVGVKTTFNASTRNAQLKDIRIALDDTSITGQFALNNFDKPAYRFDIKVDAIDADRYMPPAAKTEKPAQGATPGAAAAAAPVVIPLDMLRELNADGGITIKKLKSVGIRSEDVSTHLKAAGGVISVGPSRAKLYGGIYQGNIGIDARGKALALSMDEKVSGVQIGPMLKDMEIFANFSGTGDVSLVLTAHGLDAKQITESLSGKLAFSLRDGAIQGVDMLKKYEEARALYDQVKGKAPRVKAQTGEKTAFKVFSGSALITNGIAQNNDLILESPGMRATGKGSANLPKETLDYHLDIIQTKDAGKKCANIPMHISGPFADLSYAPDMEAILKCQARKQAQKQIEKKKDEVLQKGLERLFRNR